MGYNSTSQTSESLTWVGSFDGARVGSTVGLVDGDGDGLLVGFCNASERLQIQINLLSKLCAQHSQTNRVDLLWSGAWTAQT